MVRVERGLDGAVEKRGETLRQSHSFSDKEREFEGLVSVQARVAVRVVAEVQIFLADFSNVSSSALSDILASHLQVDAAWVCAHLRMHIEERSELVSYSLEWSGFEAVAALHGVAVHGIRDPQHCATFSLYGSDQLGEICTEFFRTHSDYDSNSAWDVVGVDSVDDADELFGSALVGDLHANGIVDAGDKVRVCVIQLSGALTYPKHV